MSTTLSHSDIASDRLARAAADLRLGDIAHPHDHDALIRVLDAIAAVQALIAGFAAIGNHLDDAVCVASDHLDEAACALRIAGQADLQDVIEAA